jgi:hypothetical protein
MTDQQAKEYSLRHRPGGLNKLDGGIATIEEQMPDEVNEVRREDPEALHRPFSSSFTLADLDRMIASLPEPDV